MMGYQGRACVRACAPTNNPPFAPSLAPHTALTSGHSANHLHHNRRTDEAPRPPPLQCVHISKVVQTIAACTGTATSAEAWKSRISRGIGCKRGDVHVEGIIEAPNHNHAIRTGFLSTLPLLVHPNGRRCCQHHRQASARAAPTVDRRHHTPRNSSTCTGAGAGAGAGASVCASGLQLMLGALQLQRQVYHPIECKERLQLGPM